MRCFPLVVALLACACHHRGAWSASTVDPDAIRMLVSEATFGQVAGGACADLDFRKFPWEAPR